MTTFAAISLTSPVMLLGMAAVAGPVIAHLMNRRTRRKIVFPTIVMLQEAAASQSTLFRLRRLILLALRCAAIALIAWAFARPVWLNADASSGAGQKLGLVIVADVSASMAQQSAGAAGVEAIQHLRGEAQRVLDELEPGRDVANLIGADAHPRPAFDELIANLSALRQDIDTLKATDQRADLTAAIGLAAEQLRQHDGARRIVVISDMQATNWTDLAIDPEALAADDILLTVIETPADAAANLALIRPRTNPARPVAGQPAQVIAEVVNHAAARQETSVTCRINDKTVGAMRIELEPGDRRAISFGVAFDSPGPHRIAVTSEAPDALDFDNRAYAVADVVDRATVVIISDDDPALPTGPGFYLQRALAPGGDDTDPLRLRVLQIDEITEAALADADAVVLADPARPSTSMPFDALADYIQRGGGALYLLSPGITPGVTEQNLADLARVMTLPYQPVELIEHDPALRFGEGAWSSPPLNVFDEASQFALQRVPFTRTWSVADLRADAFVMLRFSDGSPALASIAHGAGRLVLANFSPSPRSTDLAKRGVFVPLIHSLVDALRPTSTMRRDLHAGEAHTLPRPADAGRYTVIDPSSSPLPVQHIDAMLQLPRLERAGFYTIRRDDEPVDLLAVNIDPRESDLARIDTPSVRAMIEIDGKPSRTEVRRAGDAAAIEDRGMALWPWCIGAAMTALAVEMMLLRAMRS